MLNDYNPPLNNEQTRRNLTGTKSGHSLINTHDGAGQGALVSPRRLSPNTTTNTQHQQLATVQPPRTTVNRTQNTGLSSKAGNNMTSQTDIPYMPLVRNQGEPTVAGQPRGQSTVTSFVQLYPTWQISKSSVKHHSS